MNIYIYVYIHIIYMHIYIYIYIHVIAPDRNPQFRTSLLLVSIAIKKVHCFFLHEKTENMLSTMLNNVLLHQ